MTKNLDLGSARDLVTEATSNHGTPWRRVTTGDGGFYGVTDRTGSVVSGSPGVSSLIAAAPTLITNLLDRAEAAEQAVARVREVAETCTDKFLTMALFEALDGEQS